MTAATTEAVSAAGVERSCTVALPLELRRPSILKERTLRCVPMDAKLWSDMLHLGVPVLEKILRPILVYVFLVVGLRLAGKRELAQLNAFDLVVLLTLSNTVQNAII